MMDMDAPGLARVAVCYECEGTGRDGDEDCLECESGYMITRACVSCGDPAYWQYGQGNDRRRMSCRLCGATWSADDPRWLAQRVPDRLLPATV